MLPTSLALLSLLGTALAKPCSRNPCVSELLASPTQASLFCSSLLQNPPTATSTTTDRSTSTSTSIETECVTATGKPPGYVTTTITVYEGAGETITIDVTSFAAPTSTAVTTLVEGVPGSNVTRVVTTTLDSEQTVPVTVTETLVESSTTTLTQTIFSTIWDTTLSISTVSSTAQTDTVTNSISTTILDISSTTSFGATVTTGVPTATTTTTTLAVSTSTQVVTSTIVSTQFVATETVTSFTSTAVIFVATSTVTVTPITVTLPLAKKRDSGLHERVSFPYDAPDCDSEAASQACKGLGIRPVPTLQLDSHSQAKVIHIVRVLQVVKRKVRAVVYLHGEKPQTTIVTTTIRNSQTATVTRTHTVTSGEVPTSTVHSPSTLPGATLSSTLSVSNIKTISETTTATVSSTAAETANVTITVSTVVPTTVITTSAVLVTITSTVNQTLTTTISATTTIESAGVTRTVTEFITATETATSSSVTTVSSTSTWSSIASLTSSTTTSAVATVSSTLVTTCVLGETRPTPNAVLNPGFESDSDPWTFSMISRASYTGSFAVATATPAAAGCRVGAMSITAKTNSVVGAQTYLRQRVATTPGKTYQVGFSYKIQVPSGLSSTPYAVLTGYFGSEPLPVLAASASGRWQTYSTPIVAFNETTLFSVTFFLSTGKAGEYVALLDDVFVKDVDADNPNLLRNGGFDADATDPSPWTDDGDGSFGLSTVAPVWSPPNVGRATLTLTQPVPSATPLAHTIRQPIAAGLVPGTRYKTILNYNVQATYSFPSGAQAQGWNGAHIGVEYPDAPGDSAMIQDSTVAPTGGGLYPRSFTALHENAVWYWQGTAALINPRPATFELAATVFIATDSLYVVRDTSATVVLDV